MTTKPVPIEDNSMTADPAPRTAAVSDAPPAEELPRMVADGRYRLERLVARGGMGSVYLATQMALQRQVALKLMFGRTADDSRTRRFMLEANVLAKLTHRNIVTVFDHGEAEGALFMAMEYIEGDTLAERMDQKGPLPPAKALRVADQVCRALRAAHKHGVAHRDLKPSNVILTRDADDADEDVKVLDFGLVKVYAKKVEHSGDRDLTEEDAMLGSPRYMAPEQILSGEVDARTDIYAFGVLMYSMLKGKAPFDGGKVAILQAHLQRALPALDSLGPDVSPELVQSVDALIQRCTRKDPADRYQTIDEVLTELHKMPVDELDWSNSTVTRILQLPREQPASASKAKKLAAGVAVAVAVLLGLVWGLPGTPAKPVEDTHEGTAGAPVEAAPANVAPTPAPEVAPRRLRVVSQPEGATVVLSGRELGTTPLETSLLPGEHVLTLRKQGFQEQGISVLVNAETPSTLERSVELAPVTTAPVQAVSERKRHRPRSPALHAEQRAPAAIAEGPAAPANDCASPYYVDDNGIKRIKTACLGGQ